MYFQNLKIHRRGVFSESEHTPPVYFRNLEIQCGVRQSKTTVVADVDGDGDVDVDVDDDVDGDVDGDDV